jgi:hypothetical protein
VRVRYRQPRLAAEGTNLVEHPQAIEMVVNTDAPFPIRALSPVLYVGGVPVADYEHAGPNRYRFVAYNEAQLADGAEIALGWPGRPPAPQDTALRYHVEREEER